MEILRKIELKNNEYFIVIEVEYVKHTQGFPVLRLKNYKYKYWDGGDCSRLIEKVEKAYSEEKIYDKSISYMNDILYLYEKIPFISGIKEISKSSETYISKEEIEKYIKTFNIKINRNLEFKLIDEKSWNI